MNAEEFKIRISEQFKTPNSPIHTLMLNNQPVSLHRDGKLDPYRDKERFYASQYGLMFDVELIKDPKGRPTFQLQFMEMQTGIFASEVNAMYDFNGEKMKTRVYVVEHLDVCTDAMDFYIQTIELDISDDFQVSIKNNTTEWVTSYNFESCSFPEGHTKNSLRTCFEKVYRGAQSYTEYIHTQEQADRINHSMAVCSVPIAKRKQIRNIFDRVFSVGANPMFLRAILNLYQANDEYAR